MTKPDVARLLWLVAGYMGCLIIITLSLVPAAARPNTGGGGQYEHLLAYALVGFAFGMSYRSKRLLLFLGVALTAGAAILELLQNFIPGREPELAGFAASSIGAWLGLALSIFASAFLRVITKRA